VATVSGLHLGEVEDADADAGAELEVIMSSDFEDAPEEEPRERRKRALKMLHKQLARYGSRDLLRHADEQYSVPWSVSLCAGAAQAGDLSKLLWLHIEQRCPLDGSDYDSNNVAICGERSDNGVAILRWLKEEGVVLPGFELSIYAAAGGRLRTLQFLASEGYYIFDDEDLCMNAALHRQVEVLKWLHEHQAPLSEEIGEHSAAGGSVPVLIWLAEVLPNEYWTTERLTRMLQLAGCYGSLEACIWLRQRGAEWPDTLNGDMSERAAWKQCVLDWARAEGCTTAHPGFAEYSSEFPKVRGNVSYWR
jgi:hypothetical protein